MVTNNDKNQNKPTMEGEFRKKQTLSERLRYVNNGIPFYVTAVIICLIGIATFFINTSSGVSLGIFAGFVIIVFGVIVFAIGGIYDAVQQIKIAMIYLAFRKEDEINNDAELVKAEKKRQEVANALDVIMKEIDSNGKL